MAEVMLTIDERRKYLRRVQPRYLAADRAGRGALLTEMAQVTGLHRKSLTRLLAALPNLVGVVVITFILTRALPGDPAAYFAGAAATEEAIA